MELRIAIQVADPRDHKHLATTIRHAAPQIAGIQIRESSLADADIVILRRDEQQGGALLRECQATGSPIPVIYSLSATDENALLLRWPARTADITALATSLIDQIKKTTRPSRVASS